MTSINDFQSAETITPVTRSSAVGKVNLLLDGRVSQIASKLFGVALAVASLLKEADEDAKKNGHWASVINKYIKYGIDLQTDYKKTVEALTPEKISAFIKNVVLKDKNHMEITMMPEEQK